VSYFSDLSLYTYSRDQDNMVAYNVGWLSNTHSYSQGDVPQEFIKRLWIYCRVFINPMRGYSRCEFCDDQSEWPITALFNEESINLGSAEIRVVKQDGTIFASPNLIFHYILEHKYCPPDGFIDAVLKGYLPDSPEFVALKLKYRWRA
jgi:hypothetical protein